MLLTGCIDRADNYIGINVIDYDNISNKQIVNNNNNLISIKDDSIIFSHLIDYGCFFMKSQNKFGLKYFSDEEIQVTNATDTFELKINKLFDETFDISGDSSLKFIYHKIPNIDYKNESFSDILNKNYIFKASSGIEYKITFYHFQCLIQYSKGLDIYVELANYSMKRINEILILVIDTDDEVLKFQIGDILKDGFRANQYSESKIDEIVFLEIISSSILSQTPIWYSSDNFIKIYSGQFNTSQSKSKYGWLFNKNKMVVSNLLFEKDRPFHINWFNNTGIYNHNNLISFNILDGGVIEVFEIHQDGRVNTNYSKLFYSDNYKFESDKTYTD
ncbi:hypothetical protein A3850_011680 [Lewinella sp. 4G2]|nr:hypothetical protein A3850_011680 [Lewinella sp. 4G2]